MKKTLVFILGLILGLAGGFIISSLTGTSEKINGILSIKLGEYLDSDKVYTKDGKTQKGKILKETDDALYFRVKDNLFEIEKDKIKAVEKNYNLKFLKKVL